MNNTPGTKSLVKRILFFLGFLIILIICGFYFYSLLKTGKNRALFIETLHQADDTLLIGDYGKTRVLLAHALSLASSTRQKKQVLKRVYLYGEKNRFPGKMIEIIESMVEERPRDKDIAFLLSYLLLKTGHVEMAHEFLAHYSRHKKLDSVKVQALLMDGKTGETADFISSSPPFESLKLLTSKNPELFEERGTRLEDPRLFLNAALLYGQEGNVGKGYETIKRAGDLDGPDYYLPLIFFAYDSGDYRDAEGYMKEYVSRFGNHPEIYALQGDIFLYNKEYRHALAAYESSINRDPGVSASVYVNSAYIYLVQGAMEKGLDWLKKGFSQFPQDKTIVFEAGKFFFSRGKSGTAYDILHSYEENSPEDPLLRLMRYALHQEGLNSLQFRAGLWDLFNKYPDNEYICRFLFVYLLGTEDVRGAASALGLFQKMRGIREPGDEILPWVFHYQGITEFLSGEKDKGMTSLTKSLELSPDPIVFYHRGIIYSELKHYRSARHDFTQISFSSDNGTSPDKRFLSRVASALGRVYYYTKEYEKAWEECDRALFFDPDNYEVYTLKEELEEIRR